MAVLAEMPLPVGAWLERTTDGMVGQLTRPIVGGAVSVRAWYSVSHEGRLLLAVSGPSDQVQQTALPPHRQVHVWQQTQLAHCLLEDEWRQRDEKRQPTPITWCGGAVVDTAFLLGTSQRNRGAVNLGDWHWHYAATDRVREPISMANADVHHIYEMLLADLFTPMRTMNPEGHTGSERRPDGRDHTHWGDILSLPDTEDGGYEILAVRGERRRSDGQTECLVQWNGYGGEWDDWVPRAEVEGTRALAVFEEDAATETGGGRNAGTPLQSAVGRRGQGCVNTTNDISRMRYGIFATLLDANLDKLTQNSMYSILADAEPIGNQRCGKRGARHMKCDLCLLILGLSVQETGRHAHLKCPFTTLVLDLAYRAAAQTMTMNAAEQTRLRGLCPMQLVREFRHDLVTGYKAGTEGQRGQPGDAPFVAWVAATQRALVERRRRNAAQMCPADAEFSLRRIYAQIRQHAQRHAYAMRRQAEEAQKALDISKPNLTGPMAEWYKKWVASGWVSEDGKLKIPTDPGEIEGAEYMRTAPGGLRVNVRAARGHVRVRLYVGTPATAELLQAPRVTPPVAEAGDLVLYTDGSGGAPGGSGIKRAGWGFAVITGGNGEDDEAATLLASAYGPVVTDEAAPVYMGAHAHTNNTAELSGLGEALYWLLEVDAQPTRAVLLRPDSQYAVGVATGNAISKPMRIPRSRHTSATCTRGSSVNGVVESGGPTCVGTKGTSGTTTLTPWLTGVRRRTCAWRVGWGHGGHW